MNIIGVIPQHPVTLRPLGHVGQVLSKPFCNDEVKENEVRNEKMLPFYSSSKRTCASAFLKVPVK